MWTSTPCSSTSSTSFFGLGRKKQKKKEQKDEDDEDEEEQGEEEDDENEKPSPHQSSVSVVEDSLFFNISTPNIGGSAQRDEKKEGKQDQQQRETIITRMAEQPCSSNTLAPAAPPISGPSSSQVSTESANSISQSAMNSVFSSLIGGRPRIGAKGELFDRMEAKYKRLQTTRQRRKRQTKRRYRPGARVLQEIRKFQRSTKNLIPRAPFARLVREIAEEMTTPGRSVRLQSDAITALQEASEAFLATFFEAANRCATHSKRVTVMQSDFMLLRWILTTFGIQIL